MLKRLALLLIVLSTLQLAAHAESTPNAITGKDGGRMLLVPGGRFIMGSGEGNPDEALPHDRDVPAFYMDVLEVTGAQYARYLSETGAQPPPGWEGATPPKNRADLPVTNVSWLDAMKYASWAGKRLPTEAEWEKAARGVNGRRFPWGETPIKDIANLEGAKLRPPGTFPKSVSPFGCQDMAGNAWEWTADWYQAYPGSNARSIAMGTNYKVIRGGGAAYFYLLSENTGRCALRGRILPYAGEDYLGFRCAKDADPAQPAYDPAKLLAEAEQQLKQSLPKPVTLSYETEYDGYVKARQFPLEVTGANGQSGYVRVGVPFPEGLIKDITTVRVLGPDGVARPTQHKLLTPWKDKSARWVLLDFPNAAGDKCTVRFDDAPKPTKSGGLQVKADVNQVTIDTGKATFTFAKDAPIKRMQAGGKAVFTAATIDLVVDGVPLHPLGAEKMDVEDSGPLHATVRLVGWFGDESGKKWPLQYDLRAHVVADSTRANLLLTLTNLQPRTGKTEERTPMAHINEAAVRFTLPEPASQVVMAADEGVFKGEIGGRCTLLQSDAVTYKIERDGKSVGQGQKAPGWMSVPTQAGWLSVGMRHFWQNFVKALSATPTEATVHLWTGKDALEFEATMAKTHEIVLEVAATPPTEMQHMQLEPLRASMSPSWTCGTRALGGPMVPRCKESIVQLPYWELAREGGMQRWMKAMNFGLREFGDTRHGGEFKGANAAHNLEYDVPFNFLLQYMTTGHTWYLDAAEIQSRHQADIDTDHWTGQPYKHHVLHTTWYADIAHMFLRGLVLHYWTTGEQRSLEVARQIADHIAPQAAKNQGFGNERQIGWGLYALTGFYEATREEKYLDAASKLCDSLVSGMSPTGKFKIRWDNRMSLMNGMAMNGMMSVQELTGDEKLADGLLRLSRRTLGLYPECVLRTLHGYAWALTRTNDPRYLDVLDKTWGTCMEWLIDRPDATDSEVHAWRFPWFVVKYQLFPMFGKVPERLPDAASWQGQYLPGTTAEMFIRPTSDQPAPVLVIMNGLATGRAELYDSAGKLLQYADLKATDRLFQPAAFCLPAGAATGRLRLIGYGNKAWQIHHDATAVVTLFDPKAGFLDMICPKAYGYIKPGAKEIKITFEALGEGYHRITAYNPAGNVVGAAEKYMDLEDKGRYEVELTVPIDQAQSSKPWALDAFQAKVLKIEGFLPYWSSSPEQLFNPELPVSKK